MNNVYTLTLNSAIEEVIYAEDIKDDTIIGIKSKNQYLTGKAVNSGLLLSNIGVYCKMYVVCGHDTENEYLSLKNKNRIVFVKSVDGNTRINQTIVTSGSGEIKKINKGFFLSEEDADNIRASLCDDVHSGDYVLIAGSLPEGIDNCWYKNLIEDLTQRGIHVLYDAAGDTLLEGMGGAPFYIKPNQQELAGIVGKYDTDKLPFMLKEISEKYGIVNVVTTLEAEGAWGYNSDLNIAVHAYSNELFQINVMTTGCGDSFNAGFLYGLVSNENFIQSMMYGVAFGGANIVAGFPEKITLKIINDRMKYISKKIYNM